tara:strand:+ start:29 stop:550 length:522 start_codon:yes stop_codon:yes gene_type:complete
MNKLNRKNMNKSDWITLSNELIQSSELKHKRKEESFQRCDTDGFLTQAIDGQSANIDRANADICKKFGKSYFIGLYHNDKRVKAKEIVVKCQYSFSYKTLWLLHDDERAKFNNRKFLPCNHKYGKSKILNQFGLKELDEIDDAWATWSRGNSPDCSIKRVGDEWGQNAKRELN